MAKKHLPKLASCPFCGGKVSLTAVNFEWHFWCENTLCRAHVCFPYSEDAIEKFNKRSKEGKK